MCKEFKLAIFKTSIITTLVIFILSTYITLDPMYLIENIKNLLLGSNKDRVTLLTIVLLKIYFDFAINVSYLKSRTNNHNHTTEENSKILNKDD